MISKLALVMGLMLSSLSFAQAPNNGEPCRQIIDACKANGFILGEYKEGKGLWRDCVCPIMNGTKPPANTELTLPSISPQTIANCKTKRPNICKPK